MTKVEKHTEITDSDLILQMLQTIDVGLVILEPDYTIKLWNGFMKNHSGINEKQLLNKNIFDINIQISVVLTNSLSAKGSISLP